MTYALVATLEDAKKIARTLVQENSAVCVKISPGNKLCLINGLNKMFHPGFLGMKLKNMNEAKFIFNLSDVCVA